MSRTCESTFESCMAFSFEVNPANSAMKGSASASLISSSREGPQAHSRSGMLTSSAARQPGERRQGRRGLLILDLRDIGARHAHAQRQLPLAQAGTLPQTADRRGDLHFGAVRSFHFRHRQTRHEDWLRLVLIQRRAATTAKIVDGFELDEMTLIASHHFAGVHRRESRGHLGCGSARAGTKHSVRVLCGISLLQSRA